MAVPGVVAAGASVVGGFVKGREAARRERNIQDRVSKYMGATDEQLRAIISTYGGEMGEAAQRVLSMRVQQPTVTPNAPASLVETVTRDAGGSNVMLLAVVGVVALLLLKR